MLLEFVVDGAIPNSPDGRRRECDLPPSKLLFPDRVSSSAAPPDPTHGAVLFSLFLANNTKIEQEMQPKYSEGPKARGAAFNRQLLEKAPNQRNADDRLEQNN